MPRQVPSVAAAAAAAAVAVYGWEFDRLPLYYAQTRAQKSRLCHDVS